MDPHLVIGACPNDRLWDKKDTFSKHLGSSIPILLIVQVLKIRGLSAHFHLVLGLSFAKTMTVQITCSSDKPQISHK
jgi:hypothetical protein